MGNKNTMICGTCKHYARCLNVSSGIDVIDKNDTCEDWEIGSTDLELEAQRTDAAERANHQREVEEGGIK